MLSVIMLLSTASVAYAATGVDTMPHATGSIKFSNLLENPRQEYTGIDSNGNTYTVGIEPANQYSKSGYNCWKVYFYGGIVNVDFYMDVTDNKCTNAFDESISILGGTFSDDSLTRTSTYAKLTFTYTFINDFASAKAWLKGTVTGSNNEIEVDYVI